MGIKFKNCTHGAGDFLGQNSQKPVQIREVTGIWRYLEEGPRLLFAAKAQKCRAGSAGAKNLSGGAGQIFRGRQTKMRGLTAESG